MATTDNAKDRQKEIGSFLFKEVYGELPKAILRVIEDGLLQVDRLYEFYEAKKFETELDSRHGRDLANGLECKLRTMKTTFDANGWEKNTILLTPQDTKNKTGNIILGIANHKTGCFDRFLLPIGEGYNPGSAIEIRFSVLGRGYGKYTKYLLSSEKYREDVPDFVYESKYEYVIDGISYPNAYEACIANNITPKELDRRCIMVKDFLDWKKIDRSTGTQVVRTYKPRTKKKKPVYKIEGVVYYSLKDVSAAFLCTAQTVKNRCKSPKFIHWTIEEDETQ